MPKDLSESAARPARIRHTRVYRDLFPSLPPPLSDGEWRRRMSRATLTRAGHTRWHTAHTPLFTRTRTYRRARALARARARTVVRLDFPGAKTRGSRTAERSISLTEVLVARNPDECREARERNDEPPAATATERLTNGPMVGDRVLPSSVHSPAARSVSPSIDDSPTRSFPWLTSPLVALGPSVPLLRV